MLTKAKATDILNQYKGPITRAVLKIESKTGRWCKFNQMLRKYFKQKFPSPKKKKSKIIADLWSKYKETVLKIP